MKQPTPKGSVLDCRRCRVTSCGSALESTETSPEQSGGSVMSDGAQVNSPARKKPESLGGRTDLT